MNRQENWDLLQNTPKCEACNFEQISLSEIYNLKPVSWISWALRKLLEMCLAFLEMLSFFIKVARAAVAAWPTKALAKCLARVCLLHLFRLSGPLPPKQICCSAKQPCNIPQQHLWLWRRAIFSSHIADTKASFGLVTGLPYRATGLPYGNLTTGLPYGTPNALASATRSNSSSLRPDLSQKLPWNQGLDRHDKINDI